MICDKVRDVDEIGVFICADGIKLRGGKRRCEPSIYVNRPWESVVSTYDGIASTGGLRHCVVQSQSHLKSYVVVREGRLEELIYCRT